MSSTTPWMIVRVMSPSCRSKRDVTAPPPPLVPGGGGFGVGLRLGLEIVLEDSEIPWM